MPDSAASGIRVMPPGVERPPIDLDAIRAFARDLGREQYGLTEVSPKAAAESTLAHGITRAVRADCRTAYASLWLLAIPMLIVDAFRDRDGGCGW